MSVVFCHLYPLKLENLKLGVDIFFVISGFVITKSILNETQFNFKEFKNFISKRIKRILPLSIISSLSIWIIFEILAPSTFSELDTFSSIFGFQNILLGFKGRPYGGIGPNLNPYTPFWSLGVEEQYYILYPIILLILSFFIFKNKEQNFSAKLKLSKQQNFYLPLRNLLICFGIISFVLYLYNYNPADAWSYFNPFYRFWEIILGCLAFLLNSENQR